VTTQPVAGERGDWRRDEQRGPWFDELATGVVYVHQPGRTMTEYDNLLFSTLSMNPQALHVDFAFAESLEPFTGRWSTACSRSRRSSASRSRT
jgi:acyl dehydratase